MTIYQWLCLFGFPSVFVTTVTIFHTRMSQVRLQNKSLQLGVVALLRDRMLQSYTYHAKNNCITLNERESWEEMYIQYHNLGGNGMMTDIREKIKDIPIAN